MINDEVIYSVYKMLILLSWLGRPMFCLHVGETGVKN